MNEAVFRSGQERPAMLVLFAGMMGLPAFLKTGEEKKQAKTEYDNHVRMQDKEQPGNSSSLQRTRVQQLAWS